MSNKLTEVIDLQHILSVTAEDGDYYEMSPEQVKSNSDALYSVIAEIKRLRAELKEFDAVQKRYEELLHEVNVRDDVIIKQKQERDHYKGRVDHLAKRGMRLRQERERYREENKLLKSSAQMGSHNLSRFEKELESLQKERDEWKKKAERLSNKAVTTVDELENVLYLGKSDDVKEVYIRNAIRFLKEGYAE